MKEPKVTAIIASQPGWFVIDLEIGEGGRRTTSVWKIPVVAWKIIENDWAEPILADGLPNKNFYLLSPDGGVSCPHSQAWDTVEDFIDHMMNEQKK